MSSNVSISDILSITAQYLDQHSAPLQEEKQSKESNQPSKESNQPSEEKPSKEEEKPSVHSVKVKASDRNNDQVKFPEIGNKQVTEKITHGYGPKKTNLKMVGNPPNGANFFHQRFTAYNGDEGAAWQIEQQMNCFLRAVVIAFSHHLPLRLKPDHVMQAILSGFNIWVNEMGGKDKLVANKLVDPEKKKIVVDIDPSSEEGWDAAMDILGHELEKTITDSNLIRILKASYTTTTPSMMRVKNLTIASIMKKFINISFQTLCGIPYVTLEGSPEDWEKLKVVTNALLSLADGELNWWLTPLNHALDVMIETASGKNTEEKWINFLNHQSSSGFHGCNGWINAFFPFLSNRREKTIEQNGLLVEGSITSLVVDNKACGRANHYGSFLPLMSQEQYKWNYLGTERNICITAGLLDVIQWSDDCAIEPFISYQVDELE